ncbi:hypothetical protein SAMN05661096_00622 [Marivirga sericea]|uniref:Uncharacterized protein n=1 Tax=Marivirga sericea TaxID=1028 RepID=A0A1X7IG61_9BACT|nr:hypothetical protein SAMN05661096_00622 [Marivirga sericea]
MIKLALTFSLLNRVVIPFFERFCKPYFQGLLTYYKQYGNVDYATIYLNNRIAI